MHVVGFIIRKETIHNSEYKYRGDWCMGYKALMALYTRVMSLRVMAP